MGMKEYIEEIYETEEEAKREIRSWDDYQIYEFEIIKTEDNKWKLIKKLLCPMMG